MSARKLIGRRSGSGWARDVFASIIVSDCTYRVSAQGQGRNEINERLGGEIIEGKNKELLIVLIPL